LENRLEFATLLACALRSLCSHHDMPVHLAGHMSPAIAGDAQVKLQSLSNRDNARVEIVWEPHGITR